MEDIVKEIFAQYGNAMYLAQAIEKGIMNQLLVEAFKNGLTRTRYEELLQEKSALTAGQLKNEAKNLDLFDERELVLIEEFHQNRDFLAHSFWWERAVEFIDPRLQHKLLNELSEYSNKFETIDRILKIRSKEFIDKHGIDIQAEMSEMVSEGRTVPFGEYRKLSKSETVIDIFGYKPVEKVSIPIFVLEDNTFWTVAEVGLTQVKYEIDPNKKFNLNEVSDILPILQFNPRPKVIGPWNYELGLKKRGLKMAISKTDANSPFRWTLK